MGSKGKKRGNRLAKKKARKIKQKTLEKDNNDQYNKSGYGSSERARNQS